MYEDRVIAAVVPAHNEAAHIRDVISGLPAIVDHIVIVDDKSADDTAQLAETSSDPRVRVIRHERNTGVGGAIISGHKLALELGSDIDVIFAGDDQMDPAYLPTLLDPIVHEGYGFTKANRFYSSTSYQGMPAYRVFGNVILSLANKAASGYWNLFDPQNGYTATSAEVLRRLDLDAISQGYEFENDFLLNLNILNVRAKDIPIPARYGSEVSGMKMRKVVPAIGGMLFAGFFRRVLRKYVVGSFSPIALFLFSGLLLWLFSALFGAWTIYETIGPGAATTGTVLLAVVPFLMGFQLILTALTLDIQASPG
ncbi:MAG: glycosyltransferase family 2 protein [Acidimicrobiales bacterium]